MNITPLPHKHARYEDKEHLINELCNFQPFETVSEILKQLGDPTRLRIFWLLCHSEECVINISHIMNMSSPAVSHHLQTLRQHGLITARREGKEVFYRASDTEVSNLLHKATERIMDITCPEHGTDLTGTVQSVHDYIVNHLEEKLTIDSLSRKFHINPTTLKVSFKEVYGNTIASHIKEHRMEKASVLLREGDFSISEISKQVGYNSQSKFTKAFKEFFEILPTEYRKKHI